MNRLRQLVFLILIIPIIFVANPLKAADRARLEAFLEVTGFDVALESIKLSAASAPDMIGLDADAFGSEWTRITKQVFDVGIMHDLALDILAETLSEPLLVHAADFYASDLGQRLVVAENQSHLEEDEDLKREMGEAILSGLRSIEGPRMEYLQRLVSATGGAESGVRAIHEIQVRFLMAAAGAGVIEFQLEEEDLRELLAADADNLRAAIEASSLSGAAYTYQSFSDAEVRRYAEALEKEDMRRVYELMNAVQYEIMANRFEALAAAMSGLRPSQDL